MIKSSITKQLGIIAIMVPAFLSVCTTNPLFAQQRPISGKVIDMDNTAPIHGANIHYEGHRKTVTTNFSGEFKFNPERSLPFKLVTSLVGYENDTTYVKDDQPITIRLKRDIKKLAETQVYGHQTGAKTQVAQLVNALSLSENRNRSLAEVLKTISGVQLLQTGSTISKPIINGLYGNRLAILNDGMKLESQQWGNDHAPEIDVYAAHSITVVKGAESLRYGGEALGGAVLLSSKPWNRVDSLRGQISLNGFTNGKGMQGALNLEGNSPVAGLKWSLNGNYTKSGNRKTPDYYLNNTGQRIYNLNAAIDYQYKNANFEISYKQYHNEAGILSSTHIGDLASFQERLAYGRPYPSEVFGFSYDIEAPRQEVKHDVLQFAYNQQLSSDKTLSVKYAFQNNHRQEYDKRRAGRSATPSMDMILRSHALDVSYTVEGIDQKIITGLQAQTQVNNNVVGTFNTPLIPNYNAINIGAYGIYQWQRNRFAYELGARYDFKNFDAAGYDFYGKAYGGDNQFHNLSTNLGASYSIDNHMILKSNLGLAWRAPSAQELYSQNIHQSTARYERGDAALKAEKGLKWITSLNIHEKKNFLNIDVYANFINHYIYVKPTTEYVQNLAGTFPIWQYSQNNALLTGIDIQGRYAIREHLEYSANSSFIYARNLDDHNYLPLIPPLSYTHEIAFLTKGNNRWMKDVKFALGQEIYAKQFMSTASMEMAPPPPAYQLINGSISVGSLIGNNKLQTRLLVENLLNSTYKSYTDLFRYYSHGVGRNIQLTINYTF